MVSAQGCDAVIILQRGSGWGENLNDQFMASLCDKHSLA